MEVERQRFAELISGAVPFYRREQRYRRQDGTLVWCRVTVSVVRGPKGRASRMEYGPEISGARALWISAAGRDGRCVSETAGAMAMNSIILI